jgi:uncharacterized cofD-like protein
MKDPFSPDEVKIAVIGGGTGSFTLLTALKTHTSRIAALVNMADDGGSTGQLRDELGVLPPGDVRQCLVALSNTPKLRDLFNYRFEEGSLEGHAFGNLFLTALEKMTGSFADGVELASEVLGITGVVEPMTHTPVTLIWTDKNGQEMRGEWQIANADFGDEPPALTLDPAGEISSRAAKAIEMADLVVIAPGNLYGSLAPALIVSGVGEALQKSKAVKLYVCNLMTKPGQTDGFTVNDFAAEIERLAGSEFLDAVIYNTEAPSPELMDRYGKEGEASVGFDDRTLSSQHYRAYGANLLSNKIWQNPNSSDPIASHRTLIRHNPHAVARAIMKAYKTEVRSRE